MKDFIPYKQALELKELGFDEECLALFSRDKSLLIKQIPNQQECEQYFGGVLAPTFLQAFRFFREKYNISYSIDWMNRSSEFYNGYYVHFRGINDNKINQENFIVLNDELPSKGYKVYKTYEEAELACLNKLIEIVKNGAK